MTITRDPTQLERRRMEAVALFQTGLVSQSDVAREFHVSRTSISRWVRLESLAATKATGRPPLVAADAIEPLIQRVLCSLELQLAIRDEFGIRYSRESCVKMLNKRDAARRRAEKAQEEQVDRAFEEGMAEVFGGDDEKKRESVRKQVREQTRRLEGFFTRGVQ